jgi:hypothetical protein
MSWHYVKESQNAFLEIHDASVKHNSSKNPSELLPVIKGVLRHGGILKMILPQKWTLIKALGRNFQPKSD